MIIRNYRLLAVLWAGLILSVMLLLPIGAVQGATTLPTGFSDTQVASGLTNPTDIEFAPDGRLFVAEQAGKVRIAKPDRTLATFLDSSAKVDSNGERGLQALAV